MAVGERGVTMYTLSGCVHCERARLLLQRRGLPFREVRGEARGDVRPVRADHHRDAATDRNADGDPLRANSWADSLAESHAYRNPDTDAKS